MIVLSRSSLRFIVLILVYSSLLATLPACTSYFIRKECEKTDWFEYGKGVAMSGNRMSGNTYVRKCEDASTDINYTALDQGFKKGMSDYCRPEIVFATGRKGEFFAPDMCDGDNLRFLKSQHQKGVSGYCQKENGEAAGATGKPYNQICPKDLETAFLPEFRKGRKKYLEGSVRESQAQISEIQNDMNRLESQKQMIMMEMMTLSYAPQIRYESRYDSATQSYHEVQTSGEDPDTVMRRNSLQMDSNQADSQLNVDREKIEKLRTSVHEMNTELSTL